MSASIAAGSWVPTRTACKQLHVSRFTLLRLKNDYARLRPGTHWVHISPKAKSPILWNVDEIRRQMAEWSAKSNRAARQEVG